MQWVKYKPWVSKAYVHTFSSTAILKMSIPGKNVERTAWK